MASLLDPNRLLDRNAELLRKEQERREAERRAADEFNPQRIPGEAPAEYICRLWNALSCLRRKEVMTPANWSARAVAKALRPWSTGEQAAAQFVLSVWAPSEFDQFHLVDAVSCLDGAERRIIAKWIMQPFWP